MSRVASHVDPFAEQAERQRWLQLAELVGEGEFEEVVWDSHGRHARVGSLDSVAGDRAAGTAGEGVARVHGGPLLLIDLLGHEDTGRAGADLETAAGAGRPTVVWARADTCSEIKARLAGAGDVEVFEQASIEGTLLVPGGESSLEARASLGGDEFPRVDVTVVVCANLGGRAAEAARRAAILETGSERMHLAIALRELRKANATLGREQRGKSAAAAALLTQGTETRLIEELEERDARDRVEREEWIAGLHAEIEPLKEQIAAMRFRRAWRLVERLEGARRRGFPSRAVGRSNQRPQALGMLADEPGDAPPVPERPTRQEPLVGHPSMGVNDGGGGNEPALPARAHRPVAEIDVLAVEAEAVVEAAELIEHLTPQEDERADQPLGVGGLGRLLVQEVVVALARPWVEEPAKRRPADERAPDRGKGSTARLPAAVRVAQLRADHTRPGIRVTELREYRDDVLAGMGVGVGQDDPGRLGRLHPRVGVRREAARLDVANHARVLGQVG